MTPQHPDNLAGKGPFVLIYRSDWTTDMGGGPCLAPVIWPWDEPLPEGWGVCPLIHEYVPRAGRPIAMEDPSRVLTGAEVEQIAEEDDPEGERLAAQAECKDMAFRLMGMVEGIRLHGSLEAAKDAAECAERLYEALPGGEGCLEAEYACATAL